LLYACSDIVTDGAERVSVMAGRKPLPTHLELVKGTARPHRINLDEPRLAVTAQHRHRT
jgi:hypothetical protein